MKKYILLVLVIIAILVVARLTCYSVDAAEYAYVTVLGQHRETFDGASGAGLKVGFPWPIQQVQRLDRRLQQFDLGEFEQLTHDASSNTIDKILVLQAYVSWKIPTTAAVDKFVKSIGSMDQAKKILEKSVNGRLGAIVGQKRMDDLVSTAVDLETGKKRVDLTADELRSALLEGVRKEVGEYGIEVVDIRLRRFNHPSNVRGSIYDRIRAERSREAAKYESEGIRDAKDIEAKADAEVREKLAKARAEEAAIKAAADIESLKIRNEAYSQDVAFYKFLLEMQNLHSIVGGERSMLLLSTHRPLFERLFTPPLQKGEVPGKKGDK